MTDVSDTQAARSDKLDCNEPDRSDRHEDRTDLNNARISGALCRFGLVRAAGDAEIARIAELQHGHVHALQLRAAGIGRNAQAHRLRTGRLHATLPSVFLVGRPQRTELGRMMAAALYCRGDAVVADLAAAQNWGMLDTTQLLRDDQPIDVLLASRNARHHPAIRVHRTKTLARQDVRWRHGIPVTSPALTILRLAGQMDELDLETALSAGFRKNLLRRSQLEDVITRNPQAKGLRTLRCLLEQEQEQGLNDTRSVYERKLLELLKAADLPAPMTNAWVGGEFVDGVWPELKLVYEFDSWKEHRDRDRFEKDRLRDQRLLLADHRVMRITRRQIDFRPYALVARIATISAVIRHGEQLRTSA